MIDINTYNLLPEEAKLVKEYVNDVQMYPVNEGIESIKLRMALSCYFQDVELTYIQNYGILLQFQRTNFAFERLKRNNPELFI